MLNPHLRRGLLFSAPFLLTLAMSISVSAQQTGQTGGTTGGQTGTDGTATGTGTGTGTDTGGTGAVGSLDADTVFSGIERGDAVGSTASTGTGFSSLDANAGGGRAAGIGGFGGGGLGGLGALFGLGGAGAGSQTTRPAIRTRLRSAIMYSSPHRRSYSKLRLSDYDPFPVSRKCGVSTSACRARPL